MNHKSQVMDQAVSFENAIFPSLRRFQLPSLPIALLILVVGFLVLTPLFLMVLNSFQIARPGAPIVWGLEGWVKAFTTPGIIKGMYNTFTLAITRQAIALLIGCFFAWLIARTDIPWKGPLEFLFWRRSPKRWAGFCSSIRNTACSIRGCTTWELATRCSTSIHFGESCGPI